jgi:hypothetical protein
MESNPKEGYERITFDFNKKQSAITNPEKYNTYLYLDELLEIKGIIDSCILTYGKHEITDSYIKEINDYTVERALWDEYKSHRVRNKVPDGFLYLFFDKENIKLKIGRSNNPKRRLKQLEYEFSVSLVSLFEIEDMACEEEHALWLFRKHNIHGEWFSYQKEIVEYFELLKYAEENDLQYEQD